MKIWTETAVKVFDGKEHPVTITHYIGKAVYHRNGEEVVADEYHVFDYGPKQGITRSYVIYPENETQEHHDKCISELRKLAGRILLERALE